MPTFTRYIDIDGSEAQTPPAGEVSRLPLDAVDYIMDTFPIVRRKDEEKYDGDYRTKRVSLKIYDGLAESIRSGDASITV